MRAGVDPKTRGCTGIKQRCRNASRESAAHVEGRDMGNGSTLCNQHERLLANGDAGTLMCNFVVGMTNV